MAQIDKPNLHFDGKIYLGSSSAVTVSGLGFQPDWVWVKDRDNANQQVWVDVVRGAGKFLQSNLANAQVDNASQSISAFTSDGFTTGTANPANESASTTKGFMSWNWKAGNSSGSANSDGSLASTVSVNTTAGISIVKYTGNGSSGATVGHGLGAKPKVIILKSYENGQQWAAYWEALGATKYMRFNTTNGEATSSARWNNTEPTTSVFTIGNDGEVNTNTEDHIAYCFAEKKGFSKFGKYTGNGADGSSTNNFIYTGFKPKWVMVKRSNDSGQQWTICDSVRSPTNVADSMEWLFAESSGAETDEDLPYLLSNGFMPRTGHTYMNRNGFEYIYMAFAENPIVGSNNIPATAR